MPIRLPSRRRPLARAMIGFALGAAAAGSLGMALYASPASAQITVYDPTNFSQNVLTAARTLQPSSEERHTGWPESGSRCRKCAPERCCARARVQRAGRRVRQRGGPATRAGAAHAPPLGAVRPHTREKPYSSSARLVFPPVTRRSSRAFCAL